MRCGDVIELSKKPPSHIGGIGLLSVIKKWVKLWKAETSYARTCSRTAYNSTHDILQAYVSLLHYNVTKLSTSNMAAVNA